MNRTAQAEWIGIMVVMAISTVIAIAALIAEWGDALQRMRLEVIFFLPVPHD